MSTVKAGEFVCATSGCYSDFSVHGFFVAQKDFNPMEELELFLQEFPEQKADFHFEQSHFLSWLALKGLLVESQYTTLHLGDYGSASEVELR